MKLLVLIVLLSAVFCKETETKVSVTTGTTLKTHSCNSLYLISLEGDMIGEAYNSDDK
jgi:hypothetical protein